MGTPSLRMKSLEDTCRDRPRDRLTVYKLPAEKLNLLGTELRCRLGPTEAGNLLRALCEEDDATLGMIGVSHETLSERLKSRILNPKATDRIDLSRGIEHCPFGNAGSCDVPELSSATIALVKVELDAALRFSHLLVHLVAGHGFFGFPEPSYTGVPVSTSRAWPLDLALMLDLIDSEKHARVISQVYGDALTWKSRFWPVRELGPGPTSDYR